MISNKQQVLLVLFSYHNKNTVKIANVFAKTLNAQIKKPKQVNPEEVNDYSLIGFGSGIYGEKHHNSLLNLADRLPRVINKNVFIFSTSGTSWELPTKHSTLKKKLQAKGYIIVDEFNCPGLNANSFLRFLGGMNKGRPNSKDLKNAEEFAQKLKKYINKEGIERS